MPASPALRHAAAEAYATGWALSGGPMTDRVRAGLTAVLDIADTHAGHPDILEVTLDLGHLEGVWAAVYERRHGVYTETSRLVLAAWRRIARRLRTAAVVRGMLAALAELPGVPSESAAEVAAGRAAAVLLQDVPDDPAWPDLVDALAETLRRGEAEGRAGAMALAADRHQVTLDVEAAYGAAYDSLDDTARYAATAAGWARRLLGWVRSAVTRKLTTLAVRGAGRAELTAAANTVEGSTGDGAAAAAGIADMAASQAMDRGARRLYAANQVMMLDYVTAGDPGVCPGCLAFEAANPYPQQECPMPGWHPNCRCVIEPADKTLPRSVFTGWVTAYDEHRGTR